MTAPIHIGTFQIESGKIFLCDPCYEKSEQKELPALNGEWIGYVTYKDGRVEKLLAHHIDHQECLQDVQERRIESIEVGVDSGQAGIFDCDYFEDDNIVKDLDRDSQEEMIDEARPWYSFVCDKTLSEKKAGVVPFGFASNSGYGDGGYSSYIVEDKDKKIIAVMIDFMDFNEEDYEDIPDDPNEEH